MCLSPFEGLGGSLLRLLAGVTRTADTIVVSGTIGQRSGPVDVWVAVHDPVAYFAAAARAHEEVLAGGGTATLVAPRAAAAPMTQIDSTAAAATAATTKTALISALAGAPAEASRGESSTAKPARGGRKEPNRA